MVRNLEFEVMDKIWVWQGGRHHKMWGLWGGFGSTRLSRS